MTKTQELEAWEYLAEGLRSHARTIDMECAPEDSDIWAAADALSSASAAIKELEERINHLQGKVEDFAEYEGNALNERDEAQADAYKARQEAEMLKRDLDEANARSAKHWQSFRDLRTAITGEGPMCRDCADFNGRCQGDGRPCDPDEAVAEQLSTWKAAEAERDALRQALEEIRELNMTGRDENGHRWANSDMIDQTIVFVLSGSEKE